MPTKKRTTVVLVALPLIVVAAVAVYAFVLTDPAGKPYCHKIVDTAIHDWQDANDTKAFPNVDGDSSESLEALAEYLGGDTLSDKYMYVPSLRRSDRGDFVLMYLSVPTRWTWHGQRPTIFEDKAWLIVPVDMKIYGSRQNLSSGEYSERVSFTEFERRLQATIQFIETEQRPNWKAIAKQHSEFLESMQEASES